MERVAIETGEGEVWLWGEADDLAADTPAVLAVTGAFAGPNQCRPWRAPLGRPLLVVDLPGNRCPWLRSQTPEAYSRALGEVAQGLKRPLVLCGVSTGGLVALGAEAPNVAWTLALDPVLSTSEMGYLWPGFRGEQARVDSPELDAFLLAFFGLPREGEPMPVIHRQVLEGRRSPAWIIGADKVGPNPGVLSDEDVRAIQTAAGVRYTFVRGVGHMLTQGAASLVLNTLRDLVDGAAA